MKIYTKKGDTGNTSTISGEILSKHHAKIEAGGAVDETNSALAVASLYVKHEKVQKILLHLAHLMFNLGSSINKKYNSSDVKDFEINLDDVLLLEQMIDDCEKDLPKLTNFILPRGSKGAVFLHQARSIARRAETKVVALAEIEEINPNVLAFINRTSDLLFVLARYENKDCGGDILWQNKNF
ncbi:MAG: cob(I)yrinic acid a,c-diamide adenosyltransferase [Alphaproteobacteria bacterium]